MLDSGNNFLKAHSSYTELAADEVKGNFKLLSTERNPKWTVAPLSTSSTNFGGRWPGRKIPRVIAVPFAICPNVLVDPVQQSAVVISSDVHAESLFASAVPSWDVTVPI